jgi:hypothetical protein
MQVEDTPARACHACCDFWGISYSGLNLLSFLGRE